GGVNGMRNSIDPAELGRSVYGAAWRFFPVETARALYQVVKVDYAVNGCPVYIPELRNVLSCVIQGIPYPVPDVPVCTECRMNENVCTYDLGIVCLGPLTRAGCNSWCINHGNFCYGCRGMVSNPNEKGARALLERYGVPAGLIADRIGLYNTCRELVEGGHELE
ncbi:MAG: hypothetical protein OIN84_18890, partial [Candidatus Methanoperedens sp.]|nr:hypothetical protein [Candidatus Methanoperedens sp.]